MKNIEPVFTEKNCLDLGKIQNQKQLSEIPNYQKSDPRLVLNHFPIYFFLEVYGLRRNFAAKN